MEECPEGVDLIPSASKEAPNGAVHTDTSTNTSTGVPEVGPHLSKKSGRGLPTQHFKISVITPSTEIVSASPKRDTCNTCHAVFFAFLCLENVTKAITSVGTTVAKTKHIWPVTLSFTANGC